MKSSIDSAAAATVLPSPAQNVSQGDQQRFRDPGSGSKETLKDKLKKNQEIKSSNHQTTQKTPEFAFHRPGLYDFLLLPQRILKFLEQLHGFRAMSQWQASRHIFGPTMHERSIVRLCLPNAMVKHQLQIRILYHALVEHEGRSGPPTQGCTPPCSRSGVVDTK